MDQVYTLILFAGAALVLTKLFVQWSASKHTDADGNPRRRRPPCLPRLPFVGSLPFFIRATELGPFLMAESERRGNVFAFYAAGQYAVVLNGWPTIHEALVKKALHFADRRQPFVDQQYVNSHRKGIVMGQYTEEFIHRRQMSLSILKDLGFGRSLVETRIHIELDYLVESVRMLDGRRFDPENLLFRCVNGIITGFMFGRHLDYDTDPLTQQINAFMNAAIRALRPEFSLFPILRFIPNNAKHIRHFVNVNRRLFELFDDYIRNCIDNDDQSFVNTYVKSIGPSYDIEQLKFILRDLLAAGSETTMTSLRWILIVLANNPNWQRRVQEQIDEQLSGRTPSLEDARRLPYVEATILEVMRAHTVIPLSVPRNTLCDTEVNGFFIPKDTIVLPNLYSAHMDTSVWPNPDDFLPERFLDGKGRVTGKERVIPFSVGKRSCLGEPLARQELYLVVTRLLQLFDIRPPEGQSRIVVSKLVKVIVSPASFDIRLLPRSSITCSD